MEKKTLIIVESPTKSNTINKYVGKNYVVKSSMGHIRDLNPNILSIDVDNQYKPYYEVLKEKKHILKDLESQAKKASQILLAPDPDREGEAIAHHLSELLKGKNKKIFRILFNEITKEAIHHAIEKPLEIDLNKVNSQQMRRLLDRLAGYKISPVLQKKIGGPLSAGRVQSIALKLIVEREREIKAFEPEEFWTINGNFEGSEKPPFNAKLEKIGKKKISIPNQEECDKILEDLKKNDYILSQVKKRVKKRKAPPPLITSTLQQEAFKTFKFSVKRTMKLAQELYEGIDLGTGETTGLITYMRTDSFRIANDARKAAKDFITSNLGPEYYPEKPNYYARKQKIQDAHEAIRPTLPFRTPEEVRGVLNDSQLKVYKLIWQRFFASQMKEAEIEETTLGVQNGHYWFMTKGEIIKFPGFLKVLPVKSSEDLLPPLKEGETLKLLKLDPKQNFTKPPARYSEASLVRILEEKGIGRPSTYANIIDTLGKRDYVYSEQKKFVPTFLGEKVVEYLDENFKDIMAYNFTADLEKQLDMVSEGKLEWVKGIDEFYKKLQKDLEKVKDTKKLDLLVGKKCPQCNKDLQKKYSRRTHGWFIGCTGYPSCTYTEKVDQGGEEVKKDEPLDKKCPECQNTLVKRYSRKTRKYFIGCSNYPKCTYIEKAQEEPVGNCPKCEKPLTRRFSRKTRRFFVGCTGYPDCDYIAKA